MRDIETLLAETLELPKHARAELVAQILQSLDGTPDYGADEAWGIEIERRCAVIDSGEAIASDWEVLRRRIERDIFGGK